MRLIDAESLEDGLHYRVRLYHDEDVQLCVTANQIDATPTIDAVHVVRCDECWFRPKGKTYCTELERHTGDGFYCAFGQRREEES